jgi:hypothetical protein
MVLIQAQKMLKGKMRGGSGFLIHLGGKAGAISLPVPHAKPSKNHSRPLFFQGGGDQEPGPTPTD